MAFLGKSAVPVVFLKDHSTLSRSQHKRIQGTFGGVLKRQQEMRQMLSRSKSACVLVFITLGQSIQLDQTQLMRNCGSTINYHLHHEPALHVSAKLWNRLL